MRDSPVRGPHVSVRRDERLPDAEDGRVVRELMSTNLAETGEGVRRAPLAARPENHPNKGVLNYASFRQVNRHLLINGHERN